MDCVPRAGLRPLRLRAGVDTCQLCGVPTRWLKVATQQTAIARLLAKHGLAREPPPQPPARRRLVAAAAVVVLLAGSAGIHTRVDGIYLALR